MIIKDYKAFKGQHCETTATGSLLKQLGIELSEPMLFGIGEGLGFVFWRMKTMDFPFIGGRVKTDKLTENICKNLGLTLEVKETSSMKKAWKNVEEPLSNGEAVGLKLDCYHLDYFTNKIHFAGHYATLYGYDDDFVYLNDTDQQGCLVKTSIDSLALARNEKGPMSSKNLSFTIKKTKEIKDLKDIIEVSIRNNAETFLNPPIKNLCYKGIIKTATEIKKWFHSSEDIKTEFSTSAMLMERAGTGGALFRNLYRDFLKEGFEITGNKRILKGYQSFVESAKLWTEISELFLKISETKNEMYLNRASTILLQIADLEKDAMIDLQNVGTNL